MDINGNLHKLFFCGLSILKLNHIITGCGSVGRAPVLGTGGFIVGSSPTTQTKGIMLTLLFSNEAYKIGMKTGHMRQ